MRSPRYFATPQTLTDGQYLEHTPVGSTGSLRVDVVTSAGALVPAGATVVTASSGNVANASAAAALPAVASVLNYVRGFTITAGGATAASLVSATLTGVLGGTMTFTYAIPAGATLGATPLVVTFPTPIPASAVNTAITITLPAAGAGNTNAATMIHGFKI